LIVVDADAALLAMIMSPAQSWPETITIRAVRIAKFRFAARV
jgi:hypothetical protein